MNRSASLTRAAWCAVLALSASAATAATLPSGFSETTVASGLSNPTLLSMAPDGRVFVSEQSGRLRVIKNGALLSTPFLTVTVSSSGERGLLGVAFDPNYASNRYIYVFYTSTSGGNHNQVSRFRASATNPDVVEAGSETVLFRFPNLGSSNFHNGGSVGFGNDGKLYASHGENNQSSRAQNWADNFGKIIRINADGTIPTDNPQYNAQTGNARANYARGFRNPFTFAFQRSSGKLFVNDVGNSAGSGKEEVNNVVSGGNYNWPGSEGPGSFYNYTASSQGGCAITGGDFYEPAALAFPSQYHGKYFFTDYCGDFIKYINSSGTPSLQTFATGISSPTDVEVHQDGSLYYVARGSGAVRRVRFGSGPTITTQPQSQTKAPGESVTFTVAATGVGTLRYQWQRNGANIAGATSASYGFTVQASDNGAQFRCNVTDDRGTTPSNTATLTVSAGGTPTATITLPASGALYSGGDTICYSGTGTDPEDGTLPASAFTWDIIFHHDAHTHPFLGPITGVREGCFEIPRSGETSSNVFYRVHLTVADSDAQTNHVQRDVMPRKANLTVTTNPPGLQVTIDGQPFTAPNTFTGVVGIERTIGTSSPQGSCVFQGWSDGGAITHDIVTPSADTTYTATFTGCGSTVSVWPEAESGTITAPMQVLGDATASGGQYIRVAAGNNSQAAAPATGHSVIPFSVSAPGTYKIWGRVKVATNANDSFWVRVDGGAWTNWNSIPIGTSWHWDDVHDAAAGNAVKTYSLAAGSHTLTIAYREEGTQLDRLLITNDLAQVPSGTGPSDPTPTPTVTPTPTPTPTPGGNAYVWAEVESAAITAPMGVQSDAAASGGQYVTVAAGNNTQAAAPATGHAVITFTVPTSGTYKVWGRVIAATTGDDSFWVRMDSGSWTNWNEIALGSTWHWDEVHNAAAGNAVMSYTLSAGTHTLTIAYREDGTRIDRVLITNDPAFVPTGTGG